MRVLLGLSGGVDSAYAAKLLMDMGHTVEGAVLKMHEYTELAAAQSVARTVGIPLHIIDCTAEFDAIVKQNLIDEYTSARTPNPCVICNSEVKFVYLERLRESLGFDAIATGHYASLVRMDKDANVQSYNVGDELSDDEQVLFSRGRDFKKDQTYMLWRVPSYIRRRLLLPLANVDKNSVKLEAHELGIVDKQVKESQELCFIREGDYADFIEARAGKCPEGRFIDESGRELGTHKGIIRYTLGQRKGLGISAEARIFVIDINPITNDITLSLNDKLYSNIILHNVSICSSVIKAGEEYRLDVKLRYAQSPVAAKVAFQDNKASLILDAPMRAVTPGQSCVMYIGDVLVAGGFIQKAY